jgi:hypothetical protein
MVTRNEQTEREVVEPRNHIYRMLTRRKQVAGKGGPAARFVTRASEQHFLVRRLTDPGATTSRTGGHAGKSWAIGRDLVLIPGCSAEQPG